MLDIPSVVGLKVKRLREECKESGITFAAKLGISPQALSGIEHGKRGLSVNQISRLVDVLGCLPTELFILPEDIDGDLVKRQLFAEIRIMRREDVAELCSKAVSLNAARGIKP